MVDGIGATKRLLYEEPLMKIIAGMSEWRIDSFIRELEAKKAKGRILPFIRGLRFSALLVYAIREILSGTELNTNWGHLLDKDGNYCSPECDIIIHRNGHIARWNGNEKPIMDFRFIDSQNAAAVISCKSYLSSIDKKYCISIKPYVDKVWLVAECCDPKSAESLKKRALKSGYDNFYNTYFWNKDISPMPNKDEWMNFVEELKKLR